MLRLSSSKDLTARPTRAPSRLQQELEERLVKLAV